MGQLSCDLLQPLAHPAMTSGEGKLVGAPSSGIQRRVQRTSVLRQPLQHLQMSALRCCQPRPFIPRASPLSCPFQDVQVSSFGGCSASMFIPRTSYALSSKPLQHLQVSSISSSHAHLGIARAPLLGVSPLKEVEVTPFGRFAAGGSIHGATFLLHEPLAALPDALQRWQHRPVAGGPNRTHLFGKATAARGTASHPTVEEEEEEENEAASIGAAAGLF
ncbi:hypothetical protein QOT17_25627 [Balamuthia mandrillaris]